MTSLILGLATFGILLFLGTQEIILIVLVLLVKLALIFLAVWIVLKLLRRNRQSRS